MRSDESSVALPASTCEKEALAVEEVCTRGASESRRQPKSTELSKQKPSTESDATLRTRLYIASARLARRFNLGDLAAMQPLHDATLPLAKQMAKLLVGSDVEELREVIKRWVMESSAERLRRQYEQFGAKLLELKQALASAPEQPSEEELELALTMMLKLAAEAGRDPQAKGR